MPTDSFEDFVSFYYCTTGRFPGEPAPRQPESDNSDYEEEIDDDLFDDRI